MGQQEATVTAVILTNASQWHTWLALIKSNAEQAEIWVYIDPTKEPEPVNKEPTIPSIETIEANNDMIRSVRYTDLMVIYNRDYKQWEERHKVLL